MVVTLIVVAFTALYFAYGHGRGAAMSLDRIIRGSLLGYVFVALGFIFVPIVISFIFSFNEGRFPVLPIETFSTVWYEAIWNEAPVPRAFRFSIIVGLSVAAISTFIGFATAYTDFRYRFFGKNVYLALALLPPTIPVLILGLVMLMFLGRVSLVGELHSVIFAHVVYCTPFAMALIRLRLSADGPGPGAGRLEPRRQQLAGNALCDPALHHALDLRGALPHRRRLVRRVHDRVLRRRRERDPAGAGAQYDAGPGESTDQRGRQRRLRGFHYARYPGAGFSADPAAAPAASRRRFREAVRRRVMFVTVTSRHLARLGSTRPEGYGHQVRRPAKTAAPAYRSCTPRAVARQAQAWTRFLRLGARPASRPMSHRFELDTSVLEQVDGARLLGRLRVPVQQGFA